MNGSRRPTLLSISRQDNVETEHTSASLASNCDDANVADKTSSSIFQRCNNILAVSRRISLIATEILNPTIETTIIQDTTKSTEQQGVNNGSNDQVQFQDNNDVVILDDDSDTVDPVAMIGNNSSNENTVIRGLKQKSPSTCSIYVLPPGHVPAYRAVFLISNAALGAGLLNFPEAYQKVGGLEIAIAVQLFLLIFIIGAFYIIALSANQSQASTYQDMVLFMLGNRFKAVVQLIIALYFFGSAITYVIIIGEQLSCIVRFASGQGDIWYTNKTFLFIIFALLFLVPLSLPRRLKLLSYTSFFGGVGAILITSIIVVNYYNGKYRTDPEKDMETDWKTTDWKTALAGVPVICFGFQCHISSVVVYSELRDRSPRKFILCALVAMTLCAVTYSLTGSFGYKTFGNSTKADILQNYSENDILVSVARASVLGILLSSFSIVTYCARTVLDGFIVQLANISIMQAEDSERTRRVGILICWFFLILLLASLVNNIGVAIAMVGGIASLFIFTFPGLCLLKFVNRQGSRVTCKNILLIIISGIYLLLGTFIFGEATAFAILREINARYIQ